LLHTTKRFTNEALTKCFYLQVAYYSICCYKNVPWTVTVNVKANMRLTQPLLPSVFRSSKTLVPRHRGCHNQCHVCHYTFQGSTVSFYCYALFIFIGCKECFLFHLLLDWLVYHIFKFSYVQTPQKNQYHNFLYFGLIH